MRFVSFRFVSQKLHKLHKLRNAGREGEGREGVLSVCLSVWFVVCLALALASFCIVSYALIFT